VCGGRVVVSIRKEAQVVVALGSSELTFMAVAHVLATAGRRAAEIAGEARRWSEVRKARSGMESSRYRRGELQGDESGYL